MHQRLRSIAVALAAWPLLLALAVTQGQEPYRPDGHRSHPPVGWQCSPDAKEVEHRCTCHRMAGGVDDPLCEGEPDPRECSVHCWAHAHQVPDGLGGVRWESSHCACPVTCAATDDKTPAGPTSPAQAGHGGH
jgi:hypothetical protein